MKTKTKMNITTLILDFDGTLGDSRRLIVNTLQQTLREKNLPVAGEERCASTIGLSLKEAFMQLAPMTEETAESCTQTYRRIFSDNNLLGAVPPFPHVLETIRTLYQKGLTLTVASSRGRDSLPGLLNELEIAPYISLIISADDVKHHKPHPESVLVTLEQLGKKADETLVVGDTIYDIDMGKGASTLTCGVTYGNGTRSELVQAGANYLIDDFAHLISIVAP